MSGVRYWTTADFDNFEAAEKYGAAVDIIATSDEAMVSTGENDNRTTIFEGPLHRGGAEAGGTHYIIDKKEAPRSDKITYEVTYGIRSPKNATLADMYQTIPKVEAPLNEKLQELGGRNTTGLSR